MIAGKLSVVDGVSFACERVSQIAVSRKQRRLGQRVALRKVTPPPGPFQKSGFEGESQRQTRAGGELAIQPFPLLFAIGLPPEITRLGKHVAENLRMLKPYASGLQSAQARAADDCVLRTVSRMVVNARPGNNLLSQKIGVR